MRYVSQIFFNCVIQLKELWWGSGHSTPKYTPWHTEYFKLKESEHTAWAGSSLSDLSHPQPHPHTPYPCPLKEVIKPSSENCPPYSGRNPYLQRQEDSEESKQMGLVKFPLVYYTYLLPFTLSYLSMTCHSTSNTGLTVSLSLRFLMKTPMTCKMYIKFVCFNPVVLSFSV